MSSPNATIICKTCRKSFTSKGRLQAHYKYPANVKCKRAWLGEPEPLEIPQKRAQETEESNTVCKQVKPSLEKQVDFTLKDDEYMDEGEGGLDMSMLDEIDVKLEKSSATNKETSKVTEIEAKFETYCEHSSKNFCPILAK